MSRTYWEVRAKNGGMRTGGMYLVNVLEKALPDARGFVVLNFEGMDIVLNSLSDWLIKGLNARRFEVENIEKVPVVARLGEIKAAMSGEVEEEAKEA